LGFLWKEEYNTNVKILDEQHKEMFRLGRQLYEIIMGQKDAEGGAERILEELKTYIFDHFRAEEEFMRKRNYVHYQSHKNEHRYFEKEIERLEKKKRTKSDEDMIKEIFDFIFPWILNHILVEDMKLKDIVGG